MLTMRRIIVVLILIKLVLAAQTSTAEESQIWEYPSGWQIQEFPFNMLICVSRHEQGCLGHCITAVVCLDHRVGTNNHIMFIHIHTFITYIFF